MTQKLTGVHVFKFLTSNYIACTYDSPSTHWTRDD